MFYAGGVEKGQAVQLLVHAGLSEAASLEAADRSDVLCKTCLGQRLLAHTNFWSLANSDERKRIKEERERNGFVKPAPSVFRRYRALGDDAPSRVRAPALS